MLPPPPHHPRSSRSIKCASTERPAAGASRVIASRYIVSTISNPSFARLETGENLPLAHGVGDQAPHMAVRLVDGGAVGGKIDAVERASSASRLAI